MTTWIIVTGDREWACLGIAEQVVSRLLARYGPELVIEHRACMDWVNFVQCRRILLMGVSAIITSVSGAVKAAKEAIAVADQLKNAELKRAMAELMIALADTQTQLAELKLEVGNLVAENQRLKARNEGEKPKLVYGCYQFEGDQTLYCPGCWASKGVKSPTSRHSIKFRKCSVCNNTIGS